MLMLPFRLSAQVVYCQLRMTMTSLWHPRSVCQLWVSLNIRQHPLLFKIVKFSIDPDVLGYNAITNRKEFQFKMDTQSVVLALAFNANVVLISSMEEIVGTRYTIEINSTTFIAAQYIHSLFPGMIPITCISKKSNVLFCVVYYCFFKNWLS